MADPGLLSRLLPARNSPKEAAASDELSLGPFSAAALALSVSLSARSRRLKRVIASRMTLSGKGLESIRAALRDELETAAKDS